MDFFNCLIEWSEGESSYLRNFWTWASDFGEAIEKACRSADNLGVKNPNVICMDFYNFKDLPEDVFTVNDEKTFAAQEIIAFPTEISYKIPTGVILSFEENEFDDTEIKPGFDIFQYDDGLIELEAFVEERDLLKIYLDLLTILPEIRVFWVKLQEDWESKNNEEIFINEKKISIEFIKHFIESNRIDTLKNGYVTLTTYFDEGQTNINISDHKTLVVLSYDSNIIKKAGKVLNRFGLRKKKFLVCVSKGFHHWHYKPSNALNRKQLIKKLKKQDFIKWERNENS